ncbi:MAG: thioredoxin family protein [Nitrospirota bacterium]|nr:thioredoxin family protein [Nitrospirota bacterium]
MKKQIVMLFLAAGLMIAQSALAAETAPLSTPELKQAIGAGKKNTVVFFINPNGGPCKAQKEILVQLQKDRKGNFNIAYVDAMNQANQKAFYDYGVRSLPTVVVVDGKGKIAKYFPPGIQSYDVLAKTLDSIK